MCHHQLLKFDICFITVQKWVRDLNNPNYSQGYRIKVSGFPTSSSPDLLAAPVKITEPGLS